MERKSLNTAAFVKAVQENDQSVMDDFASRVIPRIIEYLMVTLKANKFLAEECAHQAFSIVLDRISNNNLDQNSSIVSYLLITARNEYFRLIKSEIREGSAILTEQYFLEPEEQIELLTDQEREKALESCLQSLNSNSRDFIEYVIRHPEYSMLKIAKIFGISPENARTRKSRIIAQLNECVSKKMR